jgi:hypothetical protein
MIRSPSSASATSNARNRPGGMTKASDRPKRISIGVIKGLAADLATGIGPGAAARTARQGHGAPKHLREIPAVFGSGAVNAGENEALRGRWSGANNAAGPVAVR